MVGKGVCQLASGSDFTLALTKDGACATSDALLKSKPQHQRGLRDTLCVVWLLTRDALPVGASGHGVLPIAPCSVVICLIFAVAVCLISSHLGAAGALYGWGDAENANIGAPIPKNKPEKRKRLRPAGPIKVSADGAGGGGGEILPIKLSNRHLPTSDE
jgi:hypothetical protein